MHPKNLPAVLDDGVIHWQCSCDNGSRIALALDVSAWDVELLDLPGVSPCSGTYWDVGLVLERWSTLKRRVDGAIHREDAPGEKSR